MASASAFSIVSPWLCNTNSFSSCSLRGLRGALEPRSHEGCFAGRSGIGGKLGGQSDTSAVPVFLLADSPALILLTFISLFFPVSLMAVTGTLLKSGPILIIYVRLLLHSFLSFVSVISPTRIRTFLSIVKHGMWTKLWATYRLAGLAPCSTNNEERYSPTTGNQCLEKKLNVGEEPSVEGSFPSVIHFMIQRCRCHILRCGWTQHQRPIIRSKHVQHSWSW